MTDPNFKRWSESFIKQRGHPPTAEDAFAYGREFGRGDTVSISQPAISSRGRTAAELYESNQKNYNKSCGICEGTYYGWCAKSGCPHRVERNGCDDQGW